MSLALRTALITRLDESATYSSLVGTRTYPDWARSSAKFPYVTLTVSGSQVLHQQQGAVGLKMYAIQLDIWAANPAQRDSVFEAVRNILDGWSGTRDGVDIRVVDLQGDSDLTERPSTGSQKPIRRKLVPLEVWFAQPEPTMT